jgi:hypothetical protein
MVDTDATRTEIQELLKAKLPGVPFRIDVKERPDSEGEPSLYILIISKDSPPKVEVRQTLVDELRAWLGKSRDDRFPYVSFIAEKEEQELHSDE